MESRRTKLAGGRLKTKKEETQDKNGHWSREFSVRSEAWPLIEHWVAERGYHLTAQRGKRRIYFRGNDTRGYVTLLDIKVEDGRVKMSAWIQVGWMARLLSFFRVPAELVIAPRGSVGIRARRQACRELNELLVALRQPVIIDSDGFHLADLDATTLWLASLFVIPAGAYLGFAMSHWDFKAGITDSLIYATLKPMGWLAPAAAALVAFHHFVVVRILANNWFRGLSMALCLALFCVLSVSQLTRAAAEMEGTKVAIYCLDGAAARCQSALANLNLAERIVVMKRLDQLHKELTRSDD